MTLDSAERRHRAADVWRGRRVLVEHEGAERFSMSVRALLRGLGDEQVEDYWADHVMALRRVRWTLATVPVPFNDPEHGAANGLTVLRPMLRAMHLRAPHLAGLAEEVECRLEALAESDADPLGEAIRAREQADETDAVLLLRGRLSRSNDDRLGVRSFASLIDLRRAMVDRVLAVGPPGWFPADLFRAPVAREFAFVYFGWLPDPPISYSLLPLQGHELEDRLPPAPPRSPIERESDLATDESAWQPQVEWRRIETTLGKHSRHAPGESVVAYLFVLASCQAVYLEAKPGASAYIADVEDTIRVRQVEIADLRSDTYLVVRSHGSGDYVAALADSILGDESAHLRELQRRWKAKLTRVVSSDGPAQAVHRLKAAGSTRSSESNLTRWLHPDGIATQSPDDFKAICSVIDEKYDPLWSAMKTLVNTHRKAGQLVRRLLIDEIRNSDTRDLLERGWQDYDLAGMQGLGALRVSKIVARSSADHEVPRGLLRVPIDIPENLWLG